MKVLVYPRSDANPYLDIVSEALSAAGCTVTRYAGVLRSPGCDIMLCHWPENLWVTTGRPPHRKVQAFMRRVGLLLEMGRLRRAGTRIVWVAHNRAPHRFPGDPGRFRQRTRRLTRQFDAVLHLTQASASDAAFAHLRHLPAAVMPHPTYPTSGPARERGEARVTRLLFIGGLEARKTASHAIAAASQLEDLEVLVTGTGGTDRLPNAPNLQVLNWRLSDGEIDSLFDGQAAVVLSQHGALNSGVLLLALSRGAPVICPRTPTNEEIAAEVGPGWLRMYDGSLSAETLRSLTAEPLPSTPPNLSERAPERCVRSAVELFQDLVSRKPKQQAEGSCATKKDAA